MALKLTGNPEAVFPKYGWGIVGEKLGDASTETLGLVLPLEEKERARELAGSFDVSRLNGKSWLMTPVNLIKVEPCADGAQEALYVEASNLTHPGRKH